MGGKGLGLRVGGWRVLGAADLPGALYHANRHWLAVNSIQTSVRVAHASISGHVAVHLPPYLL